MPKQTLVFAALLIILGLGAFLWSGSRTALLPAYPGLVLAILGGLALAFESGRRHLMHVAAVVALLGALAPRSSGFCARPRPGWGSKTCAANTGSAKPRTTFGAASSAA